MSGYPQQGQYGQYPQQGQTGYPPQNTNPSSQYPQQGYPQQGQTGYPPQNPSSQYPGQQSSQYPGQNPSSSSPYGQPGQSYPQSQQSPYGQPQQQYGQPQHQPQQQSPYGQPQQQYGQPQQGWASSYGNNIPQNEMQGLQQWFNSVDIDRSGTITANELAVYPFMGKPLGLETSKKLIKVFDKNYTGNIDFNEYVLLNRFINQMQAAFLQADQDRSGFLDSREIFNAITGAGFQLTYPTIQSICQKYDTMRNGRITVDSFIQICAHLAGVRSIFEWNDTTRSGKVTLTYDQLSHITVHLLEK